MSGAEIAAEIAAAIAQGAAETGDGTPLVVTLTTPGTMTGTAGNRTRAGGSPRSVNGLLLEYTARERAGTLIEATDRKLMIEAVEPRATTGDTVTVLGKVYAVQNADCMEHGGVLLKQELQIRG